MKEQDLDKTIRETYQQLIRKEKIDIHMIGLMDLIDRRTHELEELERIMDEEAYDLEQLDKTNLRSLFKKVLGNLEQSIDKERQEYLLAAMKVDNCRSSLKALLHEKNVLSNIQSGLYGVEKKLATLLKQKDYRISQDNPELGKKISLIDQRIINHKAKVDEINEAVDAGKAAHNALKIIIDDLSHVIGWGPIDYIGKGNYSSYKKKRFIDKASHEVLEVDALLIKLEEELHDVSIHFQLDYEQDIRYYQDFLDNFLNNLITDYVIRKKIKNSLAGVEATLDRVEITLITLGNEIKKTNKFIEEDRALKKQLLLGAV